MKMTLGEIAALVNGRLAGDASLTVEGAANLENARETDVTFAVEPHIQEAKAVKAGAILLPEGTETFPIPAIYVEDPRAAFAKLLEAFTPPLSFPEGVSKLAYVGEGAKIAADAVVMPFAVVDAHAVVESGAVVGEDPEQIDDLNPSARTGSASRRRTACIRKCRRSATWSSRTTWRSVPT